MEDYLKVEKNRIKFRTSAQGGVFMNQLKNKLPTPATAPQKAAASEAANEVKKEEEVKKDGGQKEPEAIVAIAEEDASVSSDPTEDATSKR